MGKINILFFMLSLNVGGTERHILDIVTHLNRDKFNPVICCLYGLGSLGEQFVSNEKDIKVYSNMIQNKYDLSGLWRVLQVIKNENIQILYTINSPLTQLWGTILAKFSGIGGFVTRVATTRPRFHGKRRRIVNKITLFFVDKIIAQADTHKKYLTKYEGIDEDRIEVVYNGVEIEKFSKSTDVLMLKESLGIGRNDSVIGIVARLVPEKGHSILLKAARGVVNEFPSVCFLLIGDGEEKQKLLNLTRELAIELNVIFLGSREDIPEILSILDVAVLSSVDETFSNSILEYMASGKPVVATTAGSTADIVVDGETGFLIPSVDHNALADALLTLLRDKNYSERMGKAGRNRIKEKFTISKMSDNYESLFLDLLQKR